VAYHERASSGHDLNQALIGEHLDRAPDGHRRQACLPYYLIDRRQLRARPVLTAGDPLAKDVGQLIDSPALLDVLAEYGASWQIVYDAEIGVWTAVNRPTPTAQHFICAYDLASLAVKLDATGDRGNG
jgi:hypothetical protein